MRTLVRRVNEWDAPTILKIYAPYVLESHATAELIVPTIAEFVDRIDRYSYGRGWIMSEIEGETAGFCLLTENRNDEEDLFSAEIQLYVKKGFERRGVGSSLYSLMLDIMCFGNKRQVFARIPLPNDSAVQFHRSFGFTEKAIEKGAMIKFGQAHDILLMEKRLIPAEENAVKPIKPFLIEMADYEASRIKAGNLIKKGVSKND